MGIFLIKEIKSKTGDLHFRRWRIIETPWFSIYVHGIYKADEEAHLHDHPGTIPLSCLAACSRNAGSRGLRR